ncbi:MAG: hypothetical protein ABSC06_39305 [Rhodopila sp.]
MSKSGSVPVSAETQDALTEAVFDMPLAAIDVPALVVTHAHDACPTTSPDGPARLRAALTGSPATDLFVFDGGNPSGGPCDPTALHSLVGLDSEFVARVAGWMRSR